MRMVSYLPEVKGREGKGRRYRYGEVIYYDR